MKKLFILCTSLLIFLCISAQNSATNNFCKVLSTIMSNAKDNFIKIQIERADDIPREIYYPTGNYIGSGWNTSLPFPGAQKSFIEQFSIPIDKSPVLYNPYTAFFGDFKTEAEATKTLNTIKKQLAGCLKGYKIKIISSDPKDTDHLDVRHVFTGKSGDLPAQTIVLQIEKILSFSPYEVNLMVKGLNSKPDSQRTYKEDFGIFGMNVDSLLNAWSDKNIQRQDIKSIKIGNQTWMAENLNTSTFRNGDLIPETKSQEDWNQAGKEKKPAWCYYNNDPANEKKYGKLYNWYAVNDPRGLAPKDWHIPISNEWLILKNFLGEEVSAKLRSTSGWNENRNGNNSSGFTGYPGGQRSTSSVEFMDAQMYGYWWCSTEDWARAEIYFLCWCGGTLHSRNKQKDEGFSVRCIKD